MRRCSVLMAGLAIFVSGGCGNGETGAGGVAIEGGSVSDSAETIALENVKASQSGSVWQEVANTSITVTYDRPVARGRELFGGIVPFAEVWNPGANDATAISFSRDVSINGHSLSAGKYSLWAIPEPLDADL